MGTGVTLNAIITRFREYIILRKKIIELLTEVYSLKIAQEKVKVYIGQALDLLVLVS